MSAARVALVSLTPEISQQGEANERGRGTLDRFPSYGVRRVQAALATDPTLSGVEVKLFDRQPATTGGLAEEILAFGPDVVGFASYVWSTPTMVALARTLKRALPRVTTIFGGPSAVPEQFDLAPYAGAQDYADALVVGEGDVTFRELVAAPRRSREALRAVPGLVLPGRGGWERTPPRTPHPDMDTLASPYQAGLMPHEHVACLETFRGCPLACTFCQWGVIDAQRFFSTEYLVRELEAMRASRPLYTFLIDAALNLHARAFRNLLAAEREVGYFRGAQLLCEVYPSHLRDEHLEFLATVGSVHVGLGVQSLDSDVLQASSRPFRPERLRPVVEQLLNFGLVDIEIILGLPGDTPERFRRTLEGVLELPCSVRVYRCLVLPEALMTRAPAGAELRFDPLTLELLSSRTWPEHELRATQEYVTARAQAHPNGALVGDYWWLFLGNTQRHRRAYPTVAGRTRTGAGEAAAHGA